MRIFLSCQQALQQHNVPAYSFWETYFKKGIEEAGHEWLETKAVDWAEGLVYCQENDLQAWRDRTWSQVIATIKQQHQIQPIDLFLSYLFPKQVEPNAIQEIQALGIPCVNFFCDNVREFTSVPQEFFCFDLHWVPEFKALKMYQQAKLNYIFAPMPVWIPPEQRTCNHTENYGVSFIGSRDVQREALLAQVLKAGISVEIRGAGWSGDISTNTNRLRSEFKCRSYWQKAIAQWEIVSKQGVLPWVRKTQAKFQPRVSDEVFAGFVKDKPSATEYTSVIQQSTLCLGVNRYPSYRYPFLQPDTYSRMRDVEAPMMGACYLTEWTEGLERLYELGEEIETYRTEEELVEKIQLLQANPDRRKSIRHLGQKRALAEHSIIRSLDKIIEALSLSKREIHAFNARSSINTSI